MKIDFSQAVSAAERAAAALQAARHAAGPALAALAGAALEEVAGDAPLAEQLGYAAKEAAARALLDDRAGPGDLALLETEAALTGERAAALAARIVARAEAARQVIARVTGCRRRIAARLAAAESPEAIAAALEEAKRLLSPEGTGKED